MKDYLEQTLHQSIQELPYKDEEKLPLVYRNNFKINVLKIDVLEFLLAMPTEPMSLSELRRVRMQLEKLTGHRCVFYLKQVNWYAGPKMVEEGIPFVWEAHQVYIPFLGMALITETQRTPKPCATISFLTQKLLIKALYERWQDVSAAQAAEKLDVTRMSITRCYDEIESLGLPFIETKQKSRHFFALEDKHQMWETIQPVLRNPIIRTFRFDSIIPCDMVRSGLTALSQYSLLDESFCQTFAVQKEQVKKFCLKEVREIPLNEEATCVIHEVGYLIPFEKQKAVDPLSLSLILTDIEKQDPRIEKSMNEMLEEYVW